MPEERTEPEAGTVPRAEDIVRAATETAAPGGRAVLTIGGAELKALAPHPPTSPRERRRLELAALEAGVVPRRYLRNIGTLGLEGQSALLRAAVGVAGLGGLGGSVVEILARAGVGELILIDPDSFTEDNLNRQLLAVESNVGRPKVEAAAERLAAVNSSVTVRTHRLTGDEDSFTRLFRRASVLVDCLDSLPARFALQDAARSLGLPLVHGAIAGLSGQVASIFPGDPGLESLYGPREAAPERGVELLVGNLAPTPAVVAALQAQEVVKILTGTGQPLRRRLLVLDAAAGYASVIDL